MKSLKKLVLENKICPIPWMHSEIVGSNNLVYPCCKYKGEVGKISDNFSSIWNNATYQKIRWDLSNNINHEGCSACDVPDNVFSYKKWKTETYLKNSLLDDIDIDEKNYPKVLHIGGFSNICNLACRMCNPRHSSRLETLSKKTNLKKFYSIDDISNDLPIDFCDDFINDIVYLTISGGEPFLDKKVFQFVKKFKDSKKIKKINFSTNLTKINFELFNFLSTLNVEIIISVSLDGNKRIHEYIRYGCSYDDIIRNLKIISVRYPNFLININTTISAYNAGYAIETLESFLEIEKITKIKGVMISPVILPKILHPGIFPDRVKKIYLEKYSNIDYSKYFKIPCSRQLIETSIHLIQQEEHNENYFEFLEFTKTFDKISSTNYLEIYSELIEY